MPERKIVISTDIGSDIDDALAILAAMNSALPLEAIYTTNGDVNARSFIAKHMVNLSGRKITVARGVSHPMCSEVGPYSFYEDCLIDDSFVDKGKSEYSPVTHFKEMEGVGIIPNGLDDLVERVSKEPCNILSIAPLTNIAKLITRMPSAAKNIQHLTLLGGRFSNGQNLEHNIYHDAEAANIVLSSEIPITVVPGDLCERYVLPVTALDNLQSPVGRYVQHMARAFLAAKTATSVRTHTIEGESIETVLDKVVRISSGKVQDQVELARLEREKMQLFVNLDSAYFAALDPEDYFKRYRSLLQRLRDPKFGYTVGKLMAQILEDLIPKDISISDVYVVYCFMYPDKMKTERKTVKVDPIGMSYLTDGSKHEIVVDLDFDHFKDFVHRSIR